MLFLLSCDFGILEFRLLDETPRSHPGSCFSPQSKTHPEPFGCSQERLRRRTAKPKHKLLTNRLGYRNGNRTEYPTLFGWEGSVLLISPPAMSCQARLRSSESISKFFITTET